MMRRLFVIMGVAALALAGCAGEPEEAPGTPEPTASAPAAVTDPTWSGPEEIGDDGTQPQEATAVSGPGGFAAYVTRPSDGDERFTSEVYASADGVTWEQVLATPGLAITGLLAGGPGYVAIGTQYLAPDPPSDERRAPWAAWSADGQTWEDGSVALPSEESSGTVDTAGPAPATDEGTVVVPVTAEMSISGAWLTDLVDTPDGFVALGHSQEGGRTNILWTSADGQTWTPLPEDPFGGDVTALGLAAGTGGYAAHSSAESGGDAPGALVAWHSADARTWEQAVGDPSFEESGVGPLIAGLVPFGDGFVMVGTRPDLSPAAWTSPDGQTWGPPAPLPSLSETSASVYSVAASGDLVVAGGREVVDEGDDNPSQYPGLWTSTDGEEWSQEPPEELRGDRTEDGISVDQVAWTGEYWLALGVVWDYPEEITTAVAWTGE